jgi:hypothetical protein
MASPTKFTSTVIGYGKDDGCKESVWSIEPGSSGDTKKLVNTVRFYSAYETKPVSTQAGVAAYSDLGSSVCTGAVKSTDTQTLVNSVGGDAKFAYYNAGGKELTMHGLQAPTVVGGPTDPGSAAFTASIFGSQSYAQQSSLRIASVDFVGQAAAGTKRAQKLDMLVTADTLEAKPLMKNKVSVPTTQIDPMVMSTAH